MKSEKERKQSKRLRRNTSTKKSNAKKHSWIYNHPIATLFIVLTGIAVAGFWTLFGFSGYNGPERHIYIPQNATSSDLRDSLVTNLGTLAGNRTYILWRLQHGEINRSRGFYEVLPGERALSLARRLRYGRQTPVKFTFNNARTLDNMADKISRNLEVSADEILKACDSILPAKGFTPEQYPAAFFPDTYQCFITASGEDIVNILLHYRNAFWNEDRLRKASELGLTPVEVSTLASIVEEESAKNDERPLIARLYLNRLQRGMRLQADPTVKFATGDFGLRRILNVHLATPSPYNTYLNSGLPPGPIRIASRQTIESVLDAPKHNNIYMCAKEDFSGYHNFAPDYATHMENARKYRRQLDLRGIK